MNKPALKQRSFPAGVARRICERIRGSSIAPRTWGRWRKWANVEPFAQSVTGDQLIRLAAIAYLRTQESRKELRLSEIEAAECIVSPALLDTVRQFDRRWVLGKDAAQVVAMRTGRTVSRATLYRKIPGFRMREAIDVDELLAIVA